MVLRLPANTQPHPTHPVYLCHRPQNPRPQTPYALLVSNNPPGLQDAVYNRFEELLTLMQEGKPLPLPKPAEAAAAAAAAGPAAEGSSTGAAGGQTQGKGMFDQLKELGAKAAQDTMAVAAAIKVRRGRLWLHMLYIPVWQRRRRCQVLSSRDRPRWLAGAWQGPYLLEQKPAAHHLWSTPDVEEPQAEGGGPRGHAFNGQRLTFETFPDVFLSPFLPSALLPALAKLTPCQPLPPPLASVQNQLPQAKAEHDIAALQEQQQAKKAAEQGA